MSAPDLETKSRRLFSGTCELLGLDPKNLTLTQRLRVSRASALRLQIDDLEKAQLLGQSIDINKLVDASEKLERLVGGDPDAPSQPDFTGAREELRRLLDQRADALERRRERAAPRAPAPPHDEKDPGRSFSPPPPAAPPVAQPREDGAARANATRPPEHYLKQPDEDWRKYVGADGIITPSPWRRF
jgi:hypothetical protein